MKTIQTHRRILLPGASRDEVVSLINSYKLTQNLLTARSKVLLEKLTGYKLIKKLPAFLGTQKFTAAFTRARYLSLF